MSFHFTLTRAVLLLGMMAIAVFSAAQDISVTGKVTSSTGEPLIGVTVLAKASSNGTATDTDGTYSISVPSGETVLVFTYVGYQSQEISVGTQRNIDVVLQLSASLLNEVVVIGYGTQEKSDVTGAISSVKGSDIQNLPVIGASQALQGRSAGVNVVRNGGAPGDGGSIRIRGTGTVNNADPLIIVDNVPLAFGSINDINPNDIQSIEILKDASASAIYGQRAANGVIIVTTKKGGLSERLSIELNAYTGVSNPVSTIDVLDAPTLAQLKREAFTNDGLAVPAIWNEQAFQVQRTNWQEELLNSGVTQNYDLSLRGGGERSSFAISGGYFDEKGTIKNSYFERYYLRINSDHKVNSWLTFGENIQITRQRGNFLNTTSAQTGIVWSAIRFHPGLPVIVQANDPVPGHEVGDYGSSQVSGQFGDINNPIFTADIEDDEETRHRLLGNIYAEISLFDGLKFRTNFALDGSIFDRDVFEPIISKQIRANPRNRLGRDYSESYSLLAEYFLTYDKTFGKHSLNVVGGYTAQEFISESFSAERRDFLNEDPDQRFLSNGNAVTNATGGKFENSLLSGFGRLNYAFDDKYLLSATLRSDGSSKFAEGNKWGIFPAVSAGWRVSREKFFENIRFISYLKLNASWGQLGNENVPGLQYLALITSGRRYSFGGQQITGASQGRLANPDISWETAEMINIGADLGFFQNRLLATVNYFIKDTKDMLLAPPRIGSIGTAAIPDQNVGELRNQGLELELSYQNRAGKFNYSISGNASFIQNEVTRLFDGNFLASQRYGRPNEEIARTFEGEPIATFFGWRTNGLYQTQSEIDNDANIANDPRRERGLIKPGDVRFLDLNNDGRVDDLDRTILGDPFPTITYGLNANFSYQGFDLGLFVLGVGGVEIYNADRMQGLDASYPFNMYADVQNRWNGANTSNSIPRLSTRRDNRNYRTSDLFLENGSFLRLKNLTLGYTLPAGLTQNIGLSRLRVYITGQNLLTLTEYSGLDPELGYISGNLQQNVDYAQYPQARTFVFGVTAGF